MTPWSELLDDGGYPCARCPTLGLCKDTGECQRAGYVWRRRPPLRAYFDEALRARAAAQPADNGGVG